MSTKGGGGSHGFDPSAGNKMVRDRKRKELEKSSTKLKLEIAAHKAKKTNRELVRMAESPQGKSLRKEAETNKVKNMNDEERRKRIQRKNGKNNDFFIGRNNSTFWVK